MSLFPLTAALTILLRSAFVTVPTWQIVLGVVLLLISAVGSLWLAGRVFRLGMLRYGKRLGWKEIFQGIKPGAARANKQEVIRG
jgi:ABC-2 type transport system permease protein